MRRRCRLRPMTTRPASAGPSAPASARARETAPSAAGAGARHWWCVEREEPYPLLCGWEAGSNSEPRPPPATAKGAACIDQNGRLEPAGQRPRDISDLRTTTGADMAKAVGIDLGTTNSVVAA